MHRPISVNEAAEIAGITPEGILKRITTGRLVSAKMSNKGILVCYESLMGEKFSEAQWEKEVAKWISVPEACDVACVTDGMVIRMLVDGRLSGFRLNPKAWAVSRASAEQNYREALEQRGSKKGQPRQFGASRRPKKKPTGRPRKKR